MNRKQRTGSGRPDADVAGGINDEGGVVGNDAIGDEIVSVFYRNIPDAFNADIFNRNNLVPHKFLFPI